MGSKPSKAKRPTPVETTPLETETVVVPRIPHDIIDEVLDQLAAGSSKSSITRTLRICSLVSKSWVPLCRRRLFHTISFTSEDTTKWLKKFPMPAESPAHHVRALRFSIEGYDNAPEEFCAWFTNVERVTLSGHGKVQPLWIPSSGCLPQSVTSLTINTNMLSLVQVRDIMGQLQNLDNLSLMGSLVVVPGRAPTGIGMAVRGRFGGELRLAEGYAHEDVMNMLLEVPTGLHFTDVKVLGTHDCILSTVRLVESCGKSLVKLLYTVSPHSKPHPFPWSDWFRCANY